MPHSLPANRLRPLALACAAGLAYYAGCQAGFALRFPASGISFFWPPTAVLLAGLLVQPRRAWPALLGGTFVAHAIAHSQNGVAVEAWPVQFVGNAGQALLAAWILQRFGIDRNLFANLRTVLVFIGGACIAAPAIASLFPALVYVGQGWAADFASAWRARFITNAVASLTLVPTLLALLSWTRERRRPRAGRFVEYGLLLAGMVLADTAIRALNRHDVFGLSLSLYSPAPFLLWAAIRFGGSGLSVALLGTTLLTISAAAAGHGVFVGATAGDAVLGVQMLIVLHAVPTMLLAGLLRQNRTEHRLLMDAEQRTSAILRALPDVLVVHDRQGTPLAYGHDPDGDDNEQPWLLPPAGSRSVWDSLPADVIPAYRAAIETVTPQTAEILEYTQDRAGGPRRFEVRITAIDSARILAIVRDITDRWLADTALRQSQERYALATAAGSLGIWDLDIHTGRVHLHGSLAQALGYTDDEIGDTAGDWMRLVVEPDREAMQSRLEALVDGSLAHLEIEYRILCKDGSERWLVVNGRVSSTVDGRPARISGTYMDVTRRKESERALQNAHATVARIGRVSALAQLSASISHELRQPLTAIAANASACLRWLNAPASRDDIRGALTDVVNDAHRASHIVRSTHELFTNRPVEKAQLDVNQVIRSVVEIVAARLRESAVDVELRLARDLPTVAADPVLLQQVLLNLVSNAVDATRSIPITRREIRIDSRAGRRVAIVSVRDNGPGLESDEARRVFQPFYTNKLEGTGMGLALSHSIVKDHGGTLWAVRNARGGATFRFSIPLADPRERGPRRPAAVRVERAETLSRSSS